MLNTLKYKVLVIAPSWVGDLVMSQTLFKQLKKQYGDSLELHVFANSWSNGILQRMPEVFKIIDNPFEHKELSIFKRVKLGIKLRVNKYNHVFVLPNSLKSAIMPFFAGIKKRTGFVGEFRYGLLNDMYKLDKGSLPRMIDRFCALANGGKIPYKIEYPQLTTDIQNQFELQEKYSIYPQANKLIAFCPAAEYGPSKRWLPEYFAKLSDMLVEDTYTIIILGSKKDYEIGNSIINQVKLANNIINLCGLTDLTDTVDLLSLCNFVITNDSGLMHVACSVNTEVIAIYGSSSPTFTPPLSDKAQIVNVELECSPCFKRTCQYGHYNCMRFVTSDVIYNRIARRRL